MTTKCPIIGFTLKKSAKTTHHSRSVHTTLLHNLPTFEWLYIGCTVYLSLSYIEVVSLPSSSIGNTTDLHDVSYKCLRSFSKEYIPAFKCCSSPTNFFDRPAVFFTSLSISMSSPSPRFRVTYQKNTTHYITDSELYSGHGHAVAIKTSAASNFTGRR